MTWKEKALDFINQHPGATDSDIENYYKKTHPKLRHQTINIACRDLEGAGLIVRKRNPDKRGLIGNYPVGRKPAEFTSPIQTKSSVVKNSPRQAIEHSPIFSRQNNTRNVCGYEFRFIQQLIPECENGNVKEYAPQKEYINHTNLPLNPNGAGTFCRFSICAPSVSGVYLWVSANEIIYIGETINLAQRFNVGYGYISPRSCYAGGQSTNCKMNKVVMEYYKKGESIDLYFLQTKDYKQIELALLRQIHTKYNVKDNKGGKGVLDWDGNGRIDPVDIGISIAAQIPSEKCEGEKEDVIIQTTPKNSWIKILYNRFLKLIRQNINCR